MIRILSITETKDNTVSIKATLDGEDKTPYGWIVPKSYLVPESVWGSKLTNPIFEYTLYLQKN